MGEKNDGWRRILNTSINWCHRQKKIKVVVGTSTSESAYKG